MSYTSPTSPLHELHLPCISLESGVALSEISPRRSCSEDPEFEDPEDPADVSPVSPAPTEGTLKLTRAATGDTGGSWFRGAVNNLNASSSMSSLSSPPVGAQDAIDDTETEAIHILARDDQ